MNLTARYDEATRPFTFINNGVNFTCAANILRQFPPFAPVAAR